MLLHGDSKTCPLKPNWSKTAKTDSVFTGAVLAMSTLFSGGLLQLAKSPDQHDCALFLGQPIPYCTHQVVITSNMSMSSNVLKVLSAYMSIDGDTSALAG